MRKGNGTRLTRPSESMFIRAHPWLNFSCFSVRPLAKISSIQQRLFCFWSGGFSLLQPANYRGW
jgi:hypothetical protein